MERLKRIGDILYTFDSEEVFSYLKLKGQSALQFLVKDVPLVSNHLSFDFHSNESLAEINQLRNQINELLASTILKKNFVLDLKKSEIKGSLDTFVVIDQMGKHFFTLSFDYLNRSHILSPEYFARKDEVFMDLHLNTLSTLENYAIYILSLFQNDVDPIFLKQILDQKKILPQQYPFIRKMLTFYYSLDLDKPLSKDVFKNVDEKYHPFLNEMITFNEQEMTYLNQFKAGSFEPTKILPGILGENIINHPRAQLLIKRRKKL